MKEAVTRIQMLDWLRIRHKIKKKRKKKKLIKTTNENYQSKTGNNPEHLLNMDTRKQWGNKNDNQLQTETKKAIISHNWNKSQVY